MVLPASSGGRSGPIIHNGRVVDKKPWTLMGFLLSIIDLVRFFFMTIFTTAPMQSHVNEYKHSKRQPTWGGKGGNAGGGGGGGGPKIHTFAKPASVGCGGGGG
uniref:Selenoprotein K n=1 Tax=Neobodo designis TaxID=312471 RepID=A0A7S1M468_NEODS|mmetsp:Transcript_3402/g.10567  ORF Transcript_3402/g.10567 Transcript_3402/m.10567 type:complete len:103 (+) Transcript_3402:40-348(+)|eukprot:CAMPEP_0174827596 /NCGR_PEP_ID=MMETSP1114-20130205/830_1 /TAXON_ID=312471 /ORGANISM="Neobodo designis, Strain CCAP 1951/1" /LENGTH=102 /DNA_ID=CAMNT_0016061265 /DNA_START=44 /DNA_END=352 /DNA_ORIENTATION=-